MKKGLNTLMLIFAFVILACDHDDKKTSDLVKDIDGNAYQTVTIGTQIWLAENLKTTRYRNGESITLVSNNAEWTNLTSGGYCQYDNDISYLGIYGNLYNWAAVNDSRNIAPPGWHVASDADWDTLVQYLGGALVAGGKLKESGNTLWADPNSYATNETGFTALPGGYRAGNGNFEYLRYYGYWWSSTSSDASEAYSRNVSYNYESLSRNLSDKKFGFSVRCVKDK